MRIAYANARYRLDSTTGGNVHVDQFIRNVVACGSEIWTWPGDQHPDANRIPQGRFRRWAKLVSMEAIYVRIESRLPAVARWAPPHFVRPFRRPLMVWEFNTVPHFDLVGGGSPSDVSAHIAAFRQHASSCDLAVCVSEALREFVRDELRLRHAITVPNGSDPTVFGPDVPPVSLERRADSLQVVWIGSAELSWHNLDLLRGAADRLWAGVHRDAVQFHVIGAASDRLEAMPPNVRLHGAIPYRELPGWLSCMDVGLVCYRPGAGWYSSPMKLFDYMASGLAVVGSPQPQVKEIFTRLDQTDLLVPPDRPDRLADVLTGLAHDRDRVRVQGVRGRALVINRYSWRRGTQRILEEIGSLL